MEASFERGDLSARARGPRGRVAVECPPERDVRRAEERAVRGDDRELAREAAEGSRSFLHWLPAQTAIAKWIATFCYTGARDKNTNVARNRCGTRPTRLGSRHRIGERNSWSLRGR